MVSGGGSVKKMGEEGILGMSRCEIKLVSQACTRDRGREHTLAHPVAFGELLSFLLD